MYEASIGSQNFEVVEACVPVTLDVAVNKTWTHNA
jgi:hypothetical protein